MTPISDQIALPDSPPKDWGIKTRKYKLSDWRDTILCSIVAVAVPVVALIFYAQWDAITLILPPEFQAFPIAIGAVLFGAAIVSVCVSWFIESGIPKSQAANLRGDAFYAWQEDVFIPFLEQKYGLTVEKNTNLFSIWDYPQAVHNGRAIKFCIHGVDIKINDAYAHVLERSVTINPDSFMIEEVIEPTKESYRTIEPIA